MNWKWLYLKLRPAFDELGVYGVTLGGIAVSPVIVAAAAGSSDFRLNLHWSIWILALVISWAVIAVFEMRGTKDQKKIKKVLFQRYTLGFFAGSFAPMTLKAIGNVISGLFQNLQNLVG